MGLTLLQQQLQCLKQGTAVGPLCLTSQSRLGQHSMVIHPHTLQHPPRYPRAAHKQQTCAETLILHVTPFSFYPLTPHSEISVPLTSWHMCTCRYWPFLVCCHMLTGLSGTHPQKPGRHWTKVHCSRLKINSSKSIKTENTRKKWHRTVKENTFLNFTRLSNLIWF